MIFISIHLNIERQKRGFDTIKNRRNNIQKDQNHKNNLDLSRNSKKKS